jgi:hypothetical protein
VDAQDGRRAQALVGERAVVALQVLRLEAVQAVMADARTEVEPHDGPVALERPRADLARRDVVEPVVQPVTDRLSLAGCLDDSGVPLGFEGAHVCDHVGAPAADTCRRSRRPFSFLPIET